jgi:predicted metal-dependent peptidase
MSKLIKHSIDILSAEAPLLYGIRREDPTKEIEKEWRDAMSYLVFKWQFFAQMIYDGMELVFTPDVPLAATDSVHIFINHANLMLFGIDDIMQRVFVLGHEVSHRVRNDLIMSIVWRKTGQVSLGNGRWLPYDHQIMNMAMDYLVNAGLVDAKLGKMPLIGLYNKDISAKGMESCVEIYERIYKEEKRKQKEGRGPYGEGTGKLPGSGFDGHLEPVPAVIEQEKIKREHAIVRAAEIAHRTQGTIPGSLKLFLDEIIHPKVPWEQHLRASMTRKAGEPKLDWRYRNRRLAGREPDPLYFAKVGHKGAGLIVIGYDTSGSCVSPQVQQRFFGEAGGIAKDLNPERMVIVWCDATVQRVDDLDSPTDLVDLRNEINKAGGAPGGGGTDFCPVFDYIEKHQLKPDMLVYLTDTYGTFPSNAPGYPVIWCSIGGKTKVPFGELINVEL